MTDIEEIMGENLTNAQIEEQIDEIEKYVKFFEINTRRNKSGT